MPCLGYPLKHLPTANGTDMLTIPADLCGQQSRFCKVTGEATEPWFNSGLPSLSPHVLNQQNKKKVAAAKFSQTPTWSQSGEGRGTGKPLLLFLANCVSLEKLPVLSGFLVYRTDFHSFSYYIFYLHQTVLLKRIQRASEYISSNKSQHTQFI